MRELAHQSFAVLGDESPFSILVESLIPANCSNASLSFYNVSYSSSCMELDQSQNPSEYIVINSCIGTNLNIPCH